MLANIAIEEEGETGANQVGIFLVSTKTRISQHRTKLPSNTSDSSKSWALL